MLRALRILTIALLTAAVFAPSALAQDPEPGVTVDPDSPAGKEYALPVPKARSDSNGSKKKSGSELFGEGVQSGGGSNSQTTTNAAPPATTTNATPPAPTNSGSSSSSGSSSKSDSKSSSKRKSKKRKRSSSKRDDDSSATTARSEDNEQAGTSTQANATPADVAKLAADANNPDSGGLGSSLVFGALGLAVLLLGGATGLVLRRRMRSDS